MTRGYTMDDFHAEMRRRNVHGEPPTPTERCTSCNGTEFVDAIDNEGKSYRGCKRCRIGDPQDVLKKMAKIATTHGNSIVEVVPCGVHPLHYVKVFVNGGRRGCPMCEMQIEDLCRSLTPLPPADIPGVHDHAPRISQDRTQIVGCTCGWRTPPGTQNSDDTYAVHVAISRIAEGGGAR